MFPVSGPNLLKILFILLKRSFTKFKFIKKLASLKNNHDVAIIIKISNNYLFPAC